MKKTLKAQLFEVSKAHINWKKKSKVFFYGTAILLMVAPTLASSVSKASADGENSPKVTQAGERSGSLDLNVSHSNLDQAIAEAKAAGLTIKEEAQQDKGNAQGTDAITKLQKTISDDYASQTSTIQKQTSDYKTALAKYNQAEADYQKKLDEIQNAIDNHEPGAPADTIGQGINFRSSQNPDAVIKEVQFSGSGSLLKANTLKDGMSGLDSLTTSSNVSSPEFYTVGGAGNAFGLFLDKGQSVTITYSNLKSLTVGKTAAAQIKTTFKNSNGNRIGLILPKDPGNQFHYGIYANGKIFTNQAQAVQQTDTFYDASGKAIPLEIINGAIPQFFIGSLNYSKAKTQDGGTPPNDDGYNAHESASFDNTKVFVLSNDGKSLEEVTKDWKIESKDQTLTATPNDPSKYFFAGSSTNSRVVITLDTTLNEDAKTGSFTNVATINTKDGKHKDDNAKVHTTVVPPKAEEPKNPVEKVVEKVTESLPKTGEGKAALGISLFGIALLGFAAYLKRNRIVSTYRKVVRKIRK